MTTANAAPPALTRRTVATVMRHGVITASAELSPQHVAAVMAAHDIHAVATDDDDEPALIRDLDVIAAALAEEATLEHRAGTGLPVVHGDDDLATAAAAMAEAGVAHAAVAAVAGPGFAGMVSAFDIAAVVGGHDPSVTRLPRPAPVRAVPRTARLEQLTAADVMHRGVIALGPGASVRDLARLMAEWHIHAVAVAGVEPGPGGERLRWSIASATDLLQALVHGDLSARAGEVAGTEPLVVDASERVDVVAARLVEHDVAHAVVAGVGAFPEGVVSTLDVIRVLGASA